MLTKMLLPVAAASSTHSLRASSQLCTKGRVVLLISSVTWPAVTVQSSTQKMTITRTAHTRPRFRNESTTEGWALAARVDEATVVTPEHLLWRLTPRPPRLAG